jgi:hypothetical protein
MSFVLLEDQKRPLPRIRYAIFGSVRIVRPWYRIARFTYRSSRYLAAQCSRAWVRIRRTRPTDDAPSRDVQGQ